MGLYVASDRFDVVVRSHGENRVVETGLDWSEASSWCKGFNRTMRGTGVVAVPDALTSFAGDLLSDTQVPLSVQLTAAEPSVPKSNPCRFGPVGLANLGCYCMAHLMGIEPLVGVLSFA
jgi:hypothetical protein